jgi:hypothetical protein
MSTAVFKAVPVPTEMEPRIRRVEERMARVEAVLHDAAMPPAPATHRR